MPLEVPLPVVPLPPPDVPPVLPPLEVPLPVAPLPPPDVPLPVLPPLEVPPLEAPLPVVPLPLPDVPPPDVPLAELSAVALGALASPVAAGEAVAFGVSEESSSEFTRLVCLRLQYSLGSEPGVKYPFETGHLEVGFRPLSLQ